MDGIRYVMTTNVWYEDGTAGAEGTRVTTPGAKPIYLSIFTGKDAYGTVALSGQSPYRPQIMICDSADKSDPANQLTTATWKAFYQSAVLNQAWVVAFRTRHRQNTQLRGVLSTSPWRIGSHVIPPGGQHFGTP